VSCLPRGTTWNVVRRVAARIDKGVRFVSTDIDEIIGLRDAPAAAEGAKRPKIGWLKQ
jgi:hypothetical protein